VGDHRAVAHLVRDNFKVGGHLIGDWLGRLRTQRVDSFAPGQSGVVRHHGKIINTYRDEADAVHGVSLMCTHLGRAVRRNAAETSWKCSCHGFRFDHVGTVLLERPAVRGLRRFDVTVEGR
jgi:Rieske Fe-S protein